MFKEKRLYPRFNFNLPIKLCDSEFDIVTETKNISGNGTYCSVDKDIPTMTKLKIILLVPFKKNGRKILKKINCEGVVVRKEYIKNNGKHFYNLGIFFNHIKETDRKIIISYVKSLMRTPTLAEV
ncbi:MAG: PilZ domain-containing protein [Candidatus Omnitrophica bacterium]|nr:PilZ domain-containing protein [Candidatus Omnitrophota bacterium]MCM8826128.1 PilZ domain-containing protein [Candidatus Omnitrophota bacterium]